MTVFRVGQRVRIKYSADGRTDTVGKEATVLNPCIETKFGPEFHVLIDIDGLLAPLKGGGWVATPDQLEPLTDSYDLVSWESMRELWMPEHLREVA